MKGKKVMYVHGFGSSAQSGTVGRLRQMLPQATVIAYDMPIEPHDAMALLKEKCATEKPDLIIGTSMGGLYTEQLYGFDRILINPAFEIDKTMADHGLTGQQQFFNPREDGVQDFYVDKPLVKRYGEVAAQRFSGVTAEEQKRVYGLFGDRDELVHTFDMFREHYPNAIPFHGEHRTNEHTFVHYVMPVIRWIDDKQAQRTRSVIYIALDTLKDGRGMPASSAHKVYEQLIDSYDVFILAPTLSNQPEADQEARQWVNEYLNAPAWNHLIFCQQPRLLLGEFLISRQPDTQFIGTNIEYGSGSFKTWEDVGTFFQRLNP